MPWAISSTSGYLVHSGTDLEAAMASDDMTPTMDLDFALTDRAHEIRVRIYASPDGKSGWEMGIKPGTKANVYIRKFIYNVGGTIVQDTAHNVTADGVPFTLKIRVVGNSITATISALGVADTAVSYEIIDTTYNFLGFKKWGIVSDKDDATVSGVTRYELVAQTATRSEVLLVACGGRAFAALDETAIAEISGRIGDTDGPIAMVDWKGKGLTFGGGLSNEFDPVTLTLIKLSATGHPTYTLPGAGADLGTSTANIATVNRLRLFLAGVPESADILYASAVDDYKNWDYADLNLGGARAFAEPVGDTILCLAPMPNGNLFIGCRNSLRMLVGDPAIGAYEIVVLNPDLGVTSRKAAATAVSRDGTAVFTVDTTDGPYVIPGSGLPVPLTSDVITEGVNVEHEDLDGYIINLIRDPKRAMLWKFITPVTSGTATHFAYEERVGRYNPANACGLMPHSFPNSAGPTAAFSWRGKLCLGTRDGYICVFDDDAENDFGTAITSRLPLTLVADNAPYADVKLSGPRVLLSDDSGTVSLNIYSGSSPEQALTSSARRHRYSNPNVKPFSPAMLVQVSGAALCLEISSTQNWELEAVIAEVENVMPMIRRGTVNAMAIGGPCTPPVAETGGGGSGPGDGPGGSGGGTNPSGGGGPPTSGGGPAADPDSSPWTPIAEM